jgi:hypothetical protein
MKTTLLFLSVFLSASLFSQSEIYFGASHLISVDTVEVEIKFNNISNDELAGVQFDIDNVEFYSFYGGDIEMYDLTISFGPSTVIAFSLNGNTIPPSNSILTKIKMKVIDQNTDVCINNTVVSNLSGIEIPSIPGDCFSYGTLTIDPILGSMSHQNRELVTIIDQLGRETPFKPNTPLIYIYDDGSTEKVFTIE